MDPRKIEVVLREQNVTMNTEDNENIMPLITRSMVMGGGRNSMSVIRIGVDKIIQHPQYSRRTLGNYKCIVNFTYNACSKLLDIFNFCIFQIMTLP